jgi:hypothetical protein
MDQKFEVHARWKRVEGQGKFKQFYFPSQLLTVLITQLKLAAEEMSK